MELVTEELSREQLLGQVPRIAEVFSSMGVETVVVEPGWGSSVNTGELWNESEISTNDLDKFVQASVKAGVFNPGMSDLFIMNRDRTAQFKLCHESDIHLATEDQELCDRVARLWIENGLRGSLSVTKGVWSSIK